MQQSGQAGNSDNVEDHDNGHAKVRRAASGWADGTGQGGDRLMHNAMVCQGCLTGCLCRVVGARIVDSGSLFPASWISRRSFSMS
jgi:hypothetical protein